VWGQMPGHWWSGNSGKKAICQKAEYPVGFTDVTEGAAEPGKVSREVNLVALTE